MMHLLKAVWPILFFAALYVGVMQLVRFIIRRMRNVQ